MAATLLDGPLVLLMLVGIFANPLLEAEGTGFAGPFGVDPVGAGFTELTEALPEVVALALLVVDALLVVERVVTGPLAEPVDAFLGDVGVGFVLAEIGVGFTVALAALEAAALVDSEPLQGAAETLALLLTLADAAALALLLFLAATVDVALALLLFLAAIVDVALALLLVLAEAIDACLLDDVVVFATVAVFVGPLDTGPVCFALPAADTAVDLPADVLELAEDTLAGVAAAVVGLAFSTAVDREVLVAVLDGADLAEPDLLAGSALAEVIFGLEVADKDVIVVGFAFDDFIAAFVDDFGFAFDDDDVVNVGFDDVIAAFEDDVVAAGFAFDDDVIATFEVAVGFAFDDDVIAVADDDVIATFDVAVGFAFDDDVIAALDDVVVAVDFSFDDNITAPTDDEEVAADLAVDFGTDLTAQARGCTSEDALLCKALPLGSDKRCPSELTGVEFSSLVS